MEGTIDAITRDLLTMQEGLDWTVTEFVRVVDARLPPRVFYKHCPELREPCVATPSGIPVHLQLLGSDPQALAANAHQAIRLGATGLDLNFGCPAKTVNRHDGGASLLRDPERVFRVVEAVANAADGAVPVTAKVRLGFADRRLALACAEAAEAGGARHLVVHARTRNEGYRPPAHWEWIARIRHQLSIPVIANGDIWTLDDYWKARSLSGCEDVMLGRGMLADPDLAQRIRHWQRSGERLPDTPWIRRAAILEAYARRQQANLPDKVVVSLLKQWLNQMRARDAEAAARFAILRRETRLAAFLAGLTSPEPCSPQHGNRA
ncbi:tRNA-dihydrouridine synthase family protein [Halomonas sp. McH1-25]|uniref:tRNA dihydrouridine synthase n=1 Tax=unclassified Halomonas TaxID=2609666 RepID=UPI001EF561CB|nr:MULTISPECIES: tRNA-dihydrouridine synthase family protein [unclassified Halomonas]MCG7601448.1 tRNA-dihydrouridine synthase family protein [Halomonas sp. McH1-25]MCP1341989.1 tRNA-dihydrouridine synthase family protein [Halomonas sp. FL8]MCP1363362.1 tRNA-dihydrouridine synthase family protein [Halomonas sp. BBD45]MCP1365673.1 tRNA-dihydrouridine synthase family protein [Halomonas sp. BBD48]